MNDSGELFKFVIKVAAGLAVFYFTCEVIKTYIKCKYSKEVVEAEKGKKSDSLATYMFRRDDR